jgi:hypothetical protein
LISDLAPTARALRDGKVEAVDFQFKRPGYPLVLAGACALTGSDDSLAARLLNVVGAAAGAWFSFPIGRGLLGSAVVLLVLLGLFPNPVLLHARRLAEWCLWLDERLLARVAHRQVVLTVPKRLRVLFLRDRRRLGGLSRVAHPTVSHRQSSSRCQRMR